MAILTAISLAGSVLAGCGPSRSVRQADAKESEAKIRAETPATNRYPLTGRVVSVDKAIQSINIDGNEIPGFMAAMTMPYQVKDARVLDNLAPGEQIKAEIVVGDKGAYLENIVVATSAAAEHPPSEAPTLIHPFGLTAVVSKPPAIPHSPVSDPADTPWKMRSYRLCPR